MTTVTTSYWPADTSASVQQTTVGGVLRAAAAAAPGRLAMVGGLPDPSARRRWTYAQLLADAEQAARALTARFARASGSPRGRPTCPNGSSWSTRPGWPRWSWSPSTRPTVPRNWPTS